MAKKLEEVAPVESAAPAVPDCTFTEAEVQAVANFVNWVYTQCQFNVKPADIKNINKMFSEMHQHVTKIEQYIFEHRRAITSKK